MDKQESQAFEKAELEIRKLTDERVKELMTAPRTTPPEEFEILLAQAKVGMVYVRDREIMRRVVAGQSIRIINLISVSESERQKYLSVAMSPELHSLVVEDKTISKDDMSKMTSQQHAQWSNPDTEEQEGQHNHVRV
jgi:hypothetical protein